MWPLSSANPSAADESSLTHDFLPDRSDPNLIRNVFTAAKNIQIRGKDARRSWLHLTFEVPRLPRFITFDIKAYVSGNGGSSRDDDNADVESGVRLLGVVDVDGEVGWGHGHAKAHSFGELVLAVPDLTWAVVYHLSRENTFIETLDLT